MIVYDGIVLYFWNQTVWHPARSDLRECLLTNEGDVAMLKKEVNRGKDGRSQPLISCYIHQAAAKLMLVVGMCYPFMDFHCYCYKNRIHIFFFIFYTHAYYIVWFGNQLDIWGIYLQKDQRQHSQPLLGVVGLLGSVNTVTSLNNRNGFTIIGNLYNPVTGSLTYTQQMLHHIHSFSSCILVEGNVISVFSLGMKPMPWCY